MNINKSSSCCEGAAAAASWRPGGSSSRMSAYHENRNNNSRNSHSNHHCEQSIIGARASVMVYDDVQKKWIPSGTSSGLSKVQIYHHQQNNTFRVVGRKLQDHEVVINCSILKGLKYNQATATFHQWRDSKSVYGLNFSSQQDAEAFARAMMHALEVLSNRGIPNGGGVGVVGGGPGGPHMPHDEDMGYRTMTREDAAIIQQQTTTPTTVTTTNVQQQPQQGPQTPTPQQLVPQSPPTPQGHHRTSSAPPAPQPPPMSVSGPVYQQQQQPQQQQAQQPSHYSGGYGAPGMMGVSAPQMPPGVGMPYQQQPPIFSSSNSQQNLQMHQNGGGIYMTAGLHGHPMGNGMMQQQQQQQQQQGNQNVYAVCNPIPQPPAAPMNYQMQNGGGGANVVDGVGQGVIPTPPPQMPGMNPGGGAPPPPPPPSFAGISNGAPQPPQPPPAPMAPMGGGGGPPPAPSGGPVPPPPPIPNLGGPPGGMDMSSLASQLQNAKLKRGGNKAPNAPPPPVENSGSSTSSGGSGNYGTIGRTSGGGMASMMDEMQKTLARRRALTEKKEPEPGPVDDGAAGRKPWEKSNTLPHKSNNFNANGGSNGSGGNGNGNNGGSESPRPSRKRFGSASEETILKQVNGDSLSLPFSAELDNLKAEILREIRTEIQKAKQEILDVIKLELNRR